MGSLSSAMWMHRITPIDSNTPSPYELLFGRKPRSLLPCSAKTIASQHPDTKRHKEINLYRQTKQAHHYNKKAATDLRKLQPGEPVDVFNTLSRTWEPATVVRRERERTHVIRRKSREFFRTREHILRCKHNIANDFLPMVAPPPMLPRAQPSPIRDTPQNVEPPTPQPEANVAAQPPTAPAPAIAATQTNGNQHVRTRAGRIVKKPSRYSD